VPRNEVLSEALLDSTLEFSKIKFACIEVEILSGKSILPNRIFPNGNEQLSFHISHVYREVIFECCTSICIEHVLVTYYFLSLLHMIVKTTYRLLFGRILIFLSQVQQED